MDKLSDSHNSDLVGSLLMDSVQKHDGMTDRVKVLPLPCRPRAPLDGDPAAFGFGILTNIPKTIRLINLKTNDTGWTN